MIKFFITTCHLGTLWKIKWNTKYWTDDFVLVKLGLHASIFLKAIDKLNIWLSSYLFKWSDFNFQTDDFVVTFVECETCILFPIGDHFHVLIIIKALYICINEAPIWFLYSFLYCAHSVDVLFYWIIINIYRCSVYYFLIFHTTYHLFRV